ncbi:MULTISPECIES: hypothetical protein [Rhodococcus]|jgi:hypothetical protein|uniref:Uncharacterized protein n=1 Tax=Rhodococcus oxybenzonivorans TaxID=1990687 RepID=A0AAE4UYW4_9NOCA|nr:MULTISPECIES: hypothetical protein [Rhodococcus]MDV7240641.1 hypothetical protein [Rhodococcus oxybenzonivorans]MDV7265217.1 hypothetical protein [Rhodococcus oxybenzonivorans]MDV7272914.1 hypothetical protein [Rhodococcus oxybenzonivorans]MDV7333347.1 hypothetical protein [Rhodococcus oxybenzonivorans]MDV7342514.1 hypothetical protein [Rhodococcus oxybenzonivorans]
MPEQNPVKPDIVVGARVRVRRETETTAQGVVIEDFAELTTSGQSLGRDWAPVHRWAVALDDGRLVFAHDGELDVDSASSGQ